MKLMINQRPSGATTAHLVLTAAEVVVMTARQKEDLTVGLALLQAALMDDDSFETGDLAGRALEVIAAHEVADLVEA